MPNEYFIHVICLLILLTETICSPYGINNIREQCLTLTCMIYQIKLPIVIGETEWCLKAHKIINYLTTMNYILLKILFPLARSATIEMPPNSQPKFLIATGKWATAKHTPWSKAGLSLVTSPF